MKKRNSEIEKNRVSEIERASSQAHTQKPISFDDLVDLYYDRIKKFMLKRLSRDKRGNIETDAEDLTQEVFYRACRDFRAMCVSPQGWVFRIAEHELIRYYKRTRRGIDRNSIPLSGPDGKQLELPCRALSPDQMVFLNEQLEVVQNRLSLLPLKQKNAVIFYHIQGLSFYEIAKISSCSWDAVKANVTRGLRRMRQSMSWE
jgi:RNA polymerase sigma factor (sigma-70 family)